MKELKSLDQNKKNILHFAYVNFQRRKMYQKSSKKKSERLIELAFLFCNQDLDKEKVEEFEWVLACHKLSIIDYVGGMNIIVSYFRMRRDHLLPFCTV
jgi:hypothetical protein